MRPESAAVGCVIAIQNRAPEVLERTFQSYCGQTLAPADRVLLDFGSTSEFTDAYARLCRTYGWRLVRAQTEEKWHLSAAYNLAVASLRPEVEVLFKSDADVMLGPTVLETAARIGRRGYCQFQYYTTPPEVRYPERLDADGVQQVFRQCKRLWNSAGQGLFACPLAWFREVGGLDLAYREWGYEDHDIRWRAEQRLGVFEVDYRVALLVHQWHPSAVDPERAHENRDIFDQARQSGALVRNSGRLNPADIPVTVVIDADAGSTATEPSGPTAPRKPRVVFATRSMEEELYRLSGEFLDFAGIDTLGFQVAERYRMMNADAAGYFCEILRLDADYVVNFDEDAFILEPAGLLRLLETMAQGGYAACGMPDGGVVGIRRHNPLCCNACFTIFDLRRMRELTRDWPSVVAMRHRKDFELRAPPFARRTPFAFDDFEPYYGLFFALLESGERILYLDAEEGPDGITSVIKGPDGNSLILHGWYARNWQSEEATKRRYQELLCHARNVYVHPERVPVREIPPIESGPRTSRASPVATNGARRRRTLVGVHVYDRMANAEKWLRAWHGSETGDAEIFVMHNQDRPSPRETNAIQRGRPDYYLVRDNIGFDIGALQAVLGGEFDDVLPSWDQLLWCTDDFVPLRRDFLGCFLALAEAPRVGLVAGRYGYWPGHFSGRPEDRHCRTVGFLLKREPAQRLRFPAARIVARADCLAFEHRTGHLMQQVLQMGYEVPALDDPEARIMWDANHEAGFKRWPVFEAEFPETGALRPTERTLPR